MNDMIDRAARVLYEADKHWARPDASWDDATNDQRAPYRHMARRMLDAAVGLEHMVMLLREDAA